MAETTHHVTVMAATPTKQGFEVLAGTGHDPGGTEHLR